MSEFLMIAPSEFVRVPDVSVLPYSAEYFQQYETSVVSEEISQMFRDAGLITAEQNIDRVKFISETGDVWYSIG